MGLFDLLLILFVIGTLAGIVLSVIAAATRRWRCMKRALGGIAAGWVLYLGVGALVAVLTPQRVQKIGEQRCYDEVCYTVTGFTRTVVLPSRVKNLHAEGIFYVVRVTLENKSEGRAQRERGARAMLIDTRGRCYGASDAGNAALASLGRLTTLDLMLEPGQQRLVETAYDVPLGSSSLGWSLGRSFVFNPARVVIGDDMHFLHKPTITPLQ